MSTFGQRYTRRRRTARAGGQQPEGVALVLTLLLVVMLTVIVVGFNATTRTEQMAARNYSYQVVADEMAKSATEEAIAKLRTEIAAAGPGGFVTAPGRLIPTAGGGPVQLFSTAQSVIPTSQSAATEFGKLIGGTPAVVPGFKDVGTSGRYAYFIDDETTKVSLNSASTGRAPNTTNFFQRPYDIRRIPALAGAGPALAAYVANTGVTAPSFFFTTRQARAFAANTNAWETWAPALSIVQESRVNAPFQVGARNHTNRLWNRTPWGAERLLINQLPITDAGVNQLANAMTNGRLNALFTYSNTVRGFGFKYTNLVPQIAANMLMLRSPWWSASYLNTTPSPNFVPPQNALPPPGMPLPVYNVALLPLPTGGADMITPGALKKTNGIPATHFGAVPFPLLNEISPSVVYGWTATNTMTVRIVLELEFFNPYPTSYSASGAGATAGIVAQIDKARFEVVQNPPPPFVQYRGPDGSALAITRHNDQPERNPGFAGVWDPWGAGDPNALDFGLNRQLDPPNGIKIWPLPDVPARGYATEFVFFDISFTEANPTARLPGPAVYCIIDSIKILQNTNDSTSIRDWCSGNDFFNALATSSTGPAQFVIPLDLAPGGSFRGGTPALGGANLNVHILNNPAPPGLSMAKRDPRMRTPLVVSAQWSAQPAPGWAWVGGQPESLGGPNPGLLPVNFGPSTELPADQDYPNDALQAAFPALGQSGYVGLLSGGGYGSAQDLGKVPTGTPWRTLSIQALTTNEFESGPRTPTIPDWVMLDVVGIAAPPGAPGVGAVPVNPNAQGESAAGPLQVNERVAATMQSLARPVLTSMVETNFSAIATNIANRRWSTNLSSSTNNWGTLRGQFGFPSDCIALPSEITEIARVADHGAAFTTTNEARLSAFYPLISTTSRFYAIYARGEAVAKDRTGQTNTMSVRQVKTTVEVLADPGTGGVKIEKLFTEPLLD